MHQVFISYSHKDFDAASRVCTFLGRNRVSVWQDVENLRPGEVFDERIQRAIATSGFLLVLISERSANSEYVQLEVQYALEFRQRGLPLEVVPVLIEDIPVPTIFDAMHVVRINAWDDDGLKPLLDATRGEHISVLLENKRIRILALRQGARFSPDVQHPVQAIAGTTNTKYLLVFLIHSHGHAKLASYATTILKELAHSIIVSMPEIVSTLSAGLAESDALTPDKLFTKFFEILNAGYKLSVLQDPDRRGKVYSDVTIAMLVEGNIFMRNGGLAGGLVKSFAGKQGDEELWIMQLMTGNVAGSIEMQDKEYGNVFAYPLGRWSKIEPVETMALEFVNAGSIAALTSFGLKKSDSDAITRAAVPLDAIGIARHLLDTTSEERSIWQWIDPMVVTVECLEYDGVYADASELHADPRVMNHLECIAPDGDTPDAATGATTTSNSPDPHEVTEAEAIGEREDAIASRSVNEWRQITVGMLQAATELYQNGNYAAAAAGLEAAHETARKMHDVDLEISTLSSLGAAYRHLGEARRAIDIYTRALAIARKNRKDVTIATLLNNLGMAHSHLGDHDRALTCFLDAGYILEEASFPAVLANAEANAAWELHHYLGRTAEAILRLKNAMQILREHKTRCTSYGKGLPVLQEWLDNMEGRPTLTQDQVKRFAAALFEFTNASREGRRQILLDNSAMLLLPIAETVLEDQLLNEPPPDLQEILGSSLQILRRAREVGIDKALDEEEIDPNRLQCS